MKRILLSAALVAAVSTSAMAISLTAIPPYGTDTATEGRAITPDGVVVGLSGTGNGIIWDATNGTRVVLSSDGAQAAVATGVGYRMVSGAPQLVVHGLSAGWSTNWFSDDGGVTWNKKLRSTNIGTAPQIGVSNTMGAGGVDDTWYNTWWAANTATASQYVEKGWGTGDPPSGFFRDTKGVTTRTRMQGMSSSGRAVGMRRDASSNEQNYVLDYNGGGTPAASYFMGLDGTYLGQAWAVSGDGTKVFGMSPVLGGRAGNWPYMCTNPGASQTIVELPTFGDTTGSATNGIVYGASADGRYAVGMNYRGMEKAVLWDTVNMTILDLTELATNMGILGNFTGNLRRAYSVAVNSQGKPVVTGRGYDAVAGAYRGFVFEVPEPASLLLLALGSVALLRRRH